MQLRHAAPSILMTLVFLAGAIAADDSPEPRAPVRFGVPELKLAPVEPRQARSTDHIHVPEQLAALPQRASAPPTAPQTPSAPVAGGSGVPEHIVACESGGDYSAQNPASSASGKYQIIDQTWKANGGTTASAKDASPAEQDRVAASVLRTQGTGAWKECGG